MSIKVCYFASLKENLGKSEELIEIENSLTVDKIWCLANPEKPMPNNTLAAVNMDYVALNHLVNKGDEVAFFPPVTGG